MPSLGRSVLALAAAIAAASAIPADPYNHTQLIDHFGASTATFNQRYYQVGF